MNLSDFVDKLPAELFEELRQAVNARVHRDSETYQKVDAFFRASSDLMDLAKTNYVDAVKELKNRVSSKAPVDILLTTAFDVVNKYLKEKK